MPTSACLVSVACNASAPPCTYEMRSEEHTSELQSRSDLVCRLLLEKKKNPWDVISWSRSIFFGATWNRFWRAMNRDIDPDETGTALQDCNTDSTPSSPGLYHLHQLSSI